MWIYTLTPNEIRGTVGQFVDDVCFDVEVEPLFHPIQGLSFDKLKTKKMTLTETSLRMIYGDTVSHNASLMRKIYPSTETSKTLPDPKKCHNNLREN